MRTRKIAESEIAERKIAERKIVKKKIVVFTTAIAFLILCAAASPQIGHPPSTPTMNGSHELRVTDHEMPTLPRQIDLARLQKDALALATAAGSIPSDIEGVRKGMLPKDIVQKLKQIEKLSKQLRGELNP
jgi:pterin-4a-carbinolamine dehydratase